MALEPLALTLPEAETFVSEGGIVVVDESADATALAPGDIADAARLLWLPPRLWPISPPRHCSPLRLPTRRPSGLE